MAPLGLGEVLPTFVIPFAGPLCVFVSRSRMPFGKYAKTCLGAGVGACLYEVAQIWIPWRTFDWADMGAGLAGGILSIALGRLAFYRRHG